MIPLLHWFNAIRRLGFVSRHCTILVDSIERLLPMAMGLTETIHADTIRSSCRDGTGSNSVTAKVPLVITFNKLKLEACNYLFVWS